MAKKNEDRNAATDLPLEAWSHVMDQQWGRLDAMIDEIGRRQVQMIDQTNTAMAEVTKMAQNTLSFSSEISQEWLKAARGTTRWATDVMGAWAH